MANGSPSTVQINAVAKIIETGSFTAAALELDLI